MPREYVVKPPIEEDTWTGQYGPMVTYYFGVEGSDETHTISQKTTTDPIRSGDTLYADEVGRDKGGRVKLKRAQRDGGGGAKGGGFSPEREARIERMAAHKTAAHLLEVAGLLGLLTKERVPDRAALLKLHSSLSDALLADLSKAGPS